MHDLEREADREPATGQRRGEQLLVAALVKKFSVSQSKAQAAVDAAEQAEDADHQARKTAMFAAVAKALGKDTGAVQKAFEANKPAQPTP